MCPALTLLYRFAPRKDDDGRKGPPPPGSDEAGKQYKGGRNAFERACKRAGIRDFHFHDLRHSAASFLAMAGVDLMAIKQILGHKTVQMTVRYSHLSPGHLQKAVGAIDRALNGGPVDPTAQFTAQSALETPSEEISSGATA